MSDSAQLQTSHTSPSSRQRDQPRQQRSIETRTKLLEAAGRVFARLAFAEARLKDITEESGISSEGALFFHFGKKEDIAAAVVECQQTRMLAILNQVKDQDLSAIDSILALADGFARLIASDPLVQGGIRLTSQANIDLPNVAMNPFFRWVDIVEQLIMEGKQNGSIGHTVDEGGVSEVINAMFVGEQVLAGLADSWSSLPARVERLHPYIRAVLLE